MKLFLPALVVLVPLLAAPVTAQDNRKAIDPEANLARIMNEIVSETLECDAYYWLAAEALSHRNESSQDTVTRYKQAAEELFFRAFAYAETISLKSEAVQIRLRWALENQTELIDKNFVNISILIDKYSESCNQVYEDELESRIRYWNDRLFQKRP